MNAEEPSCEKVDLFWAHTGRYATYRVPGIVVTAEGTILAYGEARKSTGAIGVPSISSCAAALHGLPTVAPCAR
ncbi:MAG: sialidase family protein [Chloroflexota bacterium]|nr:sialidase family protein [Chloroflexota bacterium]